MYLDARRRARELAVERFAGERSRAPRSDSCQNLEGFSRARKFIALIRLRVISDVTKGTLVDARLLPLSIVIIDKKDIIKTFFFEKWNTWDGRGGRDTETRSQMCVLMHI